MLRVMVAVVVVSASSCAQTADPAYAPLAAAYSALKAKNYDVAIARFGEAIAAAPQRVATHKDLAYTLLKIGENEQARDEFAEAWRLDPADSHTGLEYAFLCFETKRQAEARRVFDKIRNEPNPEARATAEIAFQNIDRPLVEGIARWKRAVGLTPDNFSGHEELARLAEQRDEIALAAEHFERAWKIRPGECRLLLDLGRTWKALGAVEHANAALLAASRGAQPSVAEAARALLPARYPYVYEFREALKLDPANLELRRELGYLLLEMGQKGEAETEFEGIAAAATDDLLSAAQTGFLKLERKEVDAAMPLLNRVLEKGDPELADRVRFVLNLPRVLPGRPERPSREQIGAEAKDLAGKSLERGYLKDAARYLRVAHENDPLDFAVMLKLGTVHNILKDDAEALKYFGPARRSTDRAIRAEASQAWKNLRPEFARWSATVWAFPFYSTRWRDLFSYAQAKAEWNTQQFPLRPYVSVRFSGDVRGVVEAGPSSQGGYLSDRAAVLALGVETPSWRGLRGWFETGEAMNYSPGGSGKGFLTPDYRGGVGYAKGFGHMLTGAGHGWFAETNLDGVYMSRFGKDTIGYAQNRGGYTFRGPESGAQTQLYWNWNVTADLKSQYWANFVESGPGLRVRMPWLRPGALLTANAVTGRYLVSDGNPRGPTYNDVRVGIWYAFTR
jgi:Tfp pilus assembly protein PilF